MDALKNSIDQPAGNSGPTLPSYAPVMAFANRLCQVGWVMAVSIGHCYTHVESLLWRFNYFAISALLDSLISVANRLYRVLPFTCPPPLADLDSQERERAAMIFDALAK